MTDEDLRDSAFLCKPDQRIDGVGTLKHLHMGSRLAGDGQIFFQRRLILDGQFRLPDVCRE